MYGWRGWVLGLGLLCGLSASAADEDFQRLVNDYKALVRRAEAANSPEMLLTADAIQKIDALTDRRQLQAFGNTADETLLLLERQIQLVALARQLIHFKPVQANGKPDVMGNTRKLSDPLGRLSANGVRILAKVQDYHDAELRRNSADSLSDKDWTRADNGSNDFVLLLISALEVTADLHGKTNQYRMAEALVEAGPSVLGAMRPGQRKRLLNSLDMTYSKVDPMVRPPLDRFRQQLMSRECVKFCAVLSQ
ncbi:hypothetical protein [Leeia sp.]|uniref:hypothetical protein n=1 Tax=Leeia sp. TaxID=2884678 RepID=UPI0035B0CE1A